MLSSSASIPTEDGSVPVCFLLSGLTWLVMEVITVLPATLWEA